MRVWWLRVFKLDVVTVVVKVVCLQDLSLKVSGRYLNFWLSYKSFLIKWLTSEKRRKKRERERERERQRERESCGAATCRLLHTYR